MSKKLLVIAMAAIMTMAFMPMLAFAGSSGGTATGLTQEQIDGATTISVNIETSGTFPTTAVYKFTPAATDYYYVPYSGDASSGLSYTTGAGASTHYAFYPTKVCSIIYLEAGKPYYFYFTAGSTAQGNYGFRLIPMDYSSIQLIGAGSDVTWDGEYSKFSPASDGYYEFHWNYGRKQGYLFIAYDIDNVAHEVKYFSHSNIIKSGDQYKASFEDRTWPKNNGMMKFLSGHTYIIRCTNEGAAIQYDGFGVSPLSVANVTINSSGGSVQPYADFDWHYDNDAAALNGQCTLAALWTPQFAVTEKSGSTLTGVAWNGTALASGQYSIESKTVNENNYKKVIVNHSVKDGDVIQFLYNNEAPASIGGGAGGGQPGTETKDKVTTTTSTTGDGAVISTTTTANEATGVKGEVMTVTKGGDTTTSANIIVPSSSDPSAASLDTAISYAKKAEQDAAAAGIKLAAEQISFNVSGSESRFTVSKSSLENITSGTAAGIQVNMPDGGYALSAEALKQVAAKAAGSDVTITISKVPTTELPASVAEFLGGVTPVYNVSISSGNKTISSYGGQAVTLMLPMPEAEEALGLKALFVKNSGLVESVPMTVESVNGEEMCALSLQHNSYYTVVSKAVAEAAIKASNAKIAAGVRGSKVVKLNAKVSAGKVSLTWAKQGGYKLDGYQVWRSAAKASGYRLVKTTLTAKYTGKMKAGRTYYYKVRGFRTVGGEKVFTPWKVLKVKA